MLFLLSDYLKEINPAMETETSIFISRLILLLVMAVLTFASYYIAGNILDKFARRLISRTKTDWDDMLVEHGFFKRMWLFIPALVVHFMSPAVLEGSPGSIAFMRATVNIYVVIVSLRVFFSMLNWIVDVYHKVDHEEKMPIRSFVQAFKIIAFLVVVIVVLSILLDKNPKGLLSGLGALTAILMLIFKDSILGFVAGVQMNANRMVRIGDWVEMPKYGADGDVIDVSLTTVKVQNWDKTITTIPAYSMISDSFKNWRGMSESGGRRIKRCICIDMSSIKFCDEKMLEKFRKIQYISEYIDKKKKDVAQFNVEKKVDESVTVNGRRLTNIGTFRAYLAAYLRNHPMINQDMTFLVRHLQPTSQGIPIEIYVFCSDKVWANYEAVQADIFDHILAIVPEFELKVFQSPSGYDMQKMIAAVNE
ncbi:MAG: mechanosensitive ion channel family protein [Sedimentisphaeraceae bacterium JB056]